MLALRNFAGLPAAFWKLWIATLVNRLGGFVVPFLSLYLGAERHITPTVAGLIVSCFGVGCMVGGPVGGVLADRVGRKFTVVLGMTFAAATMLVLALQRSPLALGITCLCLGIATEMPRPATNALVADLVDEKDRPRAYGAIYWAANLGFACASLMAGLVSTVSFFALFAADAATCLACAAIVATGVREPERAAAATTSRGIFTQDLARPFRDAAFVSFFAASAMVGLVFFQFHVAMPLDMKAHGITTSQYGVLVAFNGILVITLQPFAPRVLAFMSTGAALAVSSVLNGVGFGMLAFSSGVGGYGCAIFVFTLGEILMAPVNPTVISALAPASLRGTYQGAFQLAFALAAAVAPVLGGPVLERFGGPVLWGACFVLGLAGAAMQLFAMRLRTVSSTHPARIAASSRTG